MIKLKRQYNLFSINRPSIVIDNLISTLLGCLGPMVIPPIHIYIIFHFWRQYTRRVDKRYCTCSCWDTVFKGTYESGIASYKHIYFNATRNSVKIWMLTTVCVIGLYEALRWLAQLLLNHRLRWSMLILFLSSIFSHYYSWWSFFNYWNDEFYSQWNHQLFFSITELASTLLVLHLADVETTVRPLFVIIIVGLAMAHIVAATLDQFLVNVVQGEGSSHQVLRDVGFMVPDVLHVLLPLLELVCAGRHSSSLLLSIILVSSLLFSLSLVYTASSL